jgi:hypothetical protein
MTNRQIPEVTPAAHIKSQKQLPEPSEQISFDFCKISEITSSRRSLA